MLWSRRTSTVVPAGTVMGSGFDSSRLASPLAGAVGAAEVSVPSGVSETPLHPLKATPATIRTPNLLIHVFMGYLLQSSYSEGQGDFHSFVFIFNYLAGSTVSRGGKNYRAKLTENGYPQAAV